MMNFQTRREFLRRTGVSAAMLPFVWNLPSLAGETGSKRKQRLIVVFTPNGTVVDNFWPKTYDENFETTPILKPLEEYRDQMLVLKGVCNKVRGDGDSHMRGMSCVLPGKELFPGNIQGGSDTPAGWASGISIDQEIKNYLQSNPETATRFGSLEFGVCVSDRADPWTRMCYAGPNQPVAPIDDPQQMFNKLYGSMRDRETLQSILDDLTSDLKVVREMVSAEDRQRLEEHTDLVRDMERDLKSAAEQKLAVDPPALEEGVPNDNDHMPEITKMQTELLVSAFANDSARLAHFQFTKSVGNAKMKWLGIEEGHHSLSHDPDLNAESQEKLTKINVWFAEQIHYLLKRLEETPEPGGEGSLLDNTMVVWTNELGKGNSHTLKNIPWVLIGNAPGFRMGRAVRLDDVPHNRLLLSFAHSFGHQIETFGNPSLAADGPLDLQS
ncbi:hypothetical protein KOR42_30830 [Thalassoglobus neptunius]|uniref:DUF1552 domain-containing protein n=1 Tax=Thalassoglobus neptunius TaxID=1938619 RepID=A0A5C5WPM9_9PLAN|nr:DUF1552 domain-containing protein [Thalassoglobus neptunius]TWT52215.1 hypothetical protein KOR42_30830 [Thalassoglobus neptunius]